MAVANVLSVISKLMLENVDSAVTNFHVGGDRILDFIDQLPAVSEVGKPDENGVHPFTAEHTMIFNEGGTVEQTAINDTTVTTIGAAGWNAGIGANALGPDPTKAPQPTVKRITVGLKETVGVIAVNKDQVFADNFGKVLVPFTRRLIEGVVKKLRNWRATMVFTDGSGWISQANTTVTVDTATDAVITLKNATTRRFEIGERYVFAAAAGWAVNGTITARTQLGDATSIAVCTGKNDKNNTVKMRIESGGTSVSCVPDVHIIKANTVTFGSPGTSLCPNGFDGLISDTGTVHGLDRSQFEILQSQVNATGSLTSLKTPDPTMITDPIDIILDAGYEQPAFVLSSRSVRSNYAYIQGGQGVFSLPGHVAVADGGFGIVQTTHEDRVYNWMLSSFIEPHTIMGIEPRAFKKYAPGGGNTVKWWMSQGGVAGVDNIFRQVLSGTRATKTFAAEWSSHFEMGILQPFLNFIERNVRGRRDA